MKRSSFFIKTQKNITSDDTLMSHKLMLKAGMIEQNASGLYILSSLGMIVLNKVSKIIRDVFWENGFQEISMPIMQSEDLWIKSGRTEIYGDETLIAIDRHKRRLVFSPTNEEMVTDYFGKVVNSYKSLPVSFYQINWKFRDEIRPRFGLMRAREFLMMDLYSFDNTHEDSINTYVKAFNSYVDIFKKIGIKVLATRADNGVIGGEFSHEFSLLANQGDNIIYYSDDSLEKVSSIEDIKAIDCAIEEKKDTLKNSINTYKQSQCIEIGHLFNFGQKYTKAMNISIQGQDGKLFNPYMGSYGIGVSRLIPAVIESSHDEKGIIWPKSISPFDIYIVDMQNNEESNKIYNELKANFSVLCDDRAVSFGEKMNDADLLGFPVSVIIGKKFVEGVVEVRHRQSGIVEEVLASDVLKRLS